ncbi:hypothetical protein BC835DRAFT_1090548 [Cytidiella melzeri]|nr:hypothetical protein BC835DRAFT_1090548 [Cytidiella melzeri]
MASLSSASFSPTTQSCGLSQRSLPDIVHYTPLLVPTSPRSSLAIAGRSPDAMSPIFTLPVELLSRVFTLGMPEGDYPDFPSYDGLPFEILVSHVCQHWRNVALRTHHLWSTIHFRLVPHLERAQHYLSRSQKHLINITVDTCAADEHIPGVTLFRDEFLPVFKTVTPHITRWRSLSLKVRDQYCKLGAREVLSSCGGAPHLEYLQLWHIEYWENAERLFTQIGPPPVVVFNKFLPALKHIVLIGVNVPWAQSPFLEDLATVEFALHSEDVRIPYDIWANMLATSPNLHKLSLLYSGPRATAPDAAWPRDVIRLPGLHDLALADLDCVYLLQLLERLAMPNVMRLRIELHDREQDFSELLSYLAEPPVTDPEDVDADSRPIFPRLETLTVAALDCTPESFKSFLQTHPCVRQLELAGKKLAHGLFGQLWTTTTTSDGNSSNGKGKEKETVEEGFTWDVAARSVTRASSSDTARSTSTTRTLETPATSTRSLPPSSAVLLPDLETLKVSGVSGSELCAFVRFRESVGMGLRCLEVSERMRDEGLEGLEREMVMIGGGRRLVWFESDEDEEDEEEGEGDDESDDEDEEEKEVGEGGGEGEGEGVLPPASDGSDDHHE